MILTDLIVPFPKAYHGHNVVGQAAGWCASLGLWKAIRKLESTTITAAPIHNLVNLQTELLASRWIGLRPQEAQTGRVPSGRARQITADRLRDQYPDGPSLHHRSRAQCPIGVFVKISNCSIHLEYYLYRKTGEWVTG